MNMPRNTSRRYTSGQLVFTLLYMDFDVNDIHACTCFIQCHANNNFMMSVIDLCTLDRNSTHNTQSCNEY